MSKKVVAITGASQGIGRAIAIKYAQMGYNVAICCRSHVTELDAVKENILRYHVDCLAYIGDMGKYEHVMSFFEQIQNKYGRLDILINNAGISHIGLLQDMTPQEWDSILAANLNSVFYCSKAAIQMMLPNKSGKILSISSVWGCVGASTEVAYSTTKGGINAFTKALAKELAPSNIQVNAIACGIIDTNMNAFLSDEEMSYIIEEIPAGRMGKSEEVAKLAYDINEKNDYLTGQIIILDGGWI